MHKVVLVSLMCFAVFAKAEAQENTCVELARVIGLNYSKSVDKDEQQAIYKADMCSESYSKASDTKKAQVAAGFKLFHATADASANAIREAQNKHCENKFGDHWRNQLKTTESQIVSREGAAVVSTCLEMTTASLHPTLVVTNKEIFFAMQYRPTVQASLKVTSFGPLACTRFG